MPMNALTPAEVLARVGQNQIKYIDLQFTDVVGIVKNVTIPAAELADALENGIWFDGSSIEGFTRIFESDMYLTLDTNTFAVIPWTRDNGQPVVARFMCDVFMSDGTPFEGDPRYILKRQLDRARKMGFIFNVGPELEFFLFRKENGKLMPLPHDTAGYFDQTTDLAMEIRQEMTAALHGFGIDVEAARKLPEYITQRQVPFYSWLRELACEHLVRLQRHHIRAKRRSVTREEPVDLRLSDESAMELAGKWGVVIVLKGHHTSITDGQRRAVNTTGNPGMATGGSGDVLTGLKPAAPDAAIRATGIPRLPA